MPLKKQIKKLLTGLSLGQEYICLAREKLTSPLTVMLTPDDSSPSIDVTSTHLFLGYQPVIIGLYGERESPVYRYLVGSAEIRLEFLPDDPNRKQQDDQQYQRAVANLMLRKVHEKVLGNVTLFLFQATRGEHYFLNYVHRSIGNWLERIRKRKSGNVQLPGNLYEQVRIAYSSPRIISLITVYDDPWINIFPTDLHGPVGNDYYTGSLRCGGLANEQVSQLKRIVISEVAASWFREAYALGKNHMKPLTETKNFSLAPATSESFKFPLPHAVLRYRELLQTDFVDIGIHRIHFYKIMHANRVKDSEPALSHIHQYYAQWRIDHGLASPWLIR